VQIKFQSRLDGYYEHPTNKELKSLLSDFEVLLDSRACHVRIGPRNFLDRASGEKRLCTFKGQQEQRSRVRSAWKPTGSALLAYRTANEVNHRFIRSNGIKMHIAKDGEGLSRAEQG
jgi:hypothetical protein